MSGFWDKLKNQLRSVIEWKNPDPAHMFFCWSARGDEIKNASKLVLNPGQGVLFLHGGKIQALHTEAGTHELATSNVPFWTTLSKVMQAFESEHKVGIYFFKTTVQLNQAWGTTSMIKYVDPIYKFPVQMGAHGNFSFAIRKPHDYFVNVLGGRESVTVDELRTSFVSRLNSPMGDFFGESKFSYQDIDGNRDEVSAALLAKFQIEFDKLGFEITDFRIDGTKFDADTQRRIERIADMQAEAHAAAAVGLNYAQVQTLAGMRDAAQNQGGLAGAGMGLGAGVGLGQMFAQGMGSMQANPGVPAAPQAAAAAADDPMVKLQRLKQMHEAGLITPAEYEQKKADILAKL